MIKQIKTKADFGVKSTNFKLFDEYVMEQNLVNAYRKTTDNPLYNCGPEKGRFIHTPRD
jgi:hypothetical protein